MWRRKSALPGWDTGRRWKLALLTCSAVAVCDAATGPHLILICVLVTGRCCALLTAWWALTAAANCYALALGAVLGVLTTSLPLPFSTHCSARSPPLAPALPSFGASAPKRGPLPASARPATAHWPREPGLRRRWPGVIAVWGGGR